MSTEVILGTTEAARRLGVCRQRIWQLIRAGRLPVQRVGRSWGVRESDLALVQVRPTGRPRKLKNLA